MARSFASASTQYLRNIVGTGPSGSSARTCACWLWVSSASTRQCAIHWGNWGLVRQTWVFGVESGKIYVGTWADDYAGTNNIPTSQWTHIAVTYASGSTAIKGYIDGVLDKTHTLGAALNTQNSNGIAIAAWFTTSAVNPLNGRVADAAIWDADLTEQEIMGLARGNYPPTVRPQSLRNYYPLGGRYGQNDRDFWKSKIDLTATNSPTWVEHPRIVYPQVMALPSKGAGGGGGGVAKPVLFHSYYMSQGMRP